MGFVNIAVGDTVAPAPTSMARGVVIGIHGDHAWVKWDSLSEPTTRTVNDLTRVAAEPAVPRTYKPGDKVKITTRSLPSTVLAQSTSGKWVWVEHGNGEEPIAYRIDKVKPWPKNAVQRHHVPWNNGGYTIHVVIDDQNWPVFVSLDQREAEAWRDAHE